MKKYFVKKNGEKVSYHIDNYDKLIGEQIGLSDWLLIDQERVDLFARATDDMNRLHTDPGWASANTPFGGTIAHGFLTLSLLSYFSYNSDMQPQGVDYGINYGFERVRFMAPVMVGDRVRCRTTLIHSARKGEDKWLFRSRNAIEMESSQRVALSAIWEVLFVRENAEAGSGAEDFAKSRA